MKTNNKLFLMFILMFSFLMLFNVSVVKANFEFTYNSEEYNFENFPEYDTEKYSNFVIFYDTSISAYVMVLQPINSSSVFVSSTGSLEFRLDPTMDTPLVAYRCYAPHLSWGSHSINQDASGAGFSNFNIDNNASRYVVYSTSDIYVDDTNTVFFYRTPVGIIAPLVDRKMMQETTLQEVVIILPMILVVVVSLVGLRKALAMLFSLLRQS